MKKVEITIWYGLVCFIFSYSSGSAFYFFYSIFLERQCKVSLQAFKVLGNAIDLSCTTITGVLNKFCIKHGTDNYRKNSFIRS